MTAVYPGKTPSKCEHLIPPQTPDKVRAPDDLQRQLATLGDLDTPALKKLWQRCHGRALPPSLSRDLLIRMTAHRLQEKALGGLTGSVKRKLKLLGEKMEAGTLKDGASAISLKPGTKLVRSWHGKTYEVSVLEEGFELNGKRYASLSKVAGEITGAHWSGPRFFGLKPRSKLAPRGPSRKKLTESKIDGGANG